jgi:hypothetical protein
MTTDLWSTVESEVLCLAEIFLDRTDREEKRGENWR